MCAWCGLNSSIILYDPTGDMMLCFFLTENDAMFEN